MKNLTTNSTALHNLFSLAVINIFFSLLVFLCGYQMVFANVEITIEWEKTFGGTANEQVNSIIQTTDGGFAIAGSTASKSSGGDDVWVIRLDSMGNKQWEKIVGEKDDDTAYSIIQTTEGDLVVAGVINLRGGGPYPFGIADLWIVKLDFMGNQKWNKIFNGSQQVAYSIVETIDRGLAVVGYTPSSITRASGWGKLRDAQIIKLDRTGNLEWKKAFGAKKGDDYARSITQTTDGGFIVAGQSDVQYPNGDDFLVVKLDRTGSLQWDRTFGGEGNDRAFSITQTTDGGVAVAGSTKSKGSGNADFWIIKLDRTGNLQWDQTFGGNSEDEAHSIIQTNDGGFAVAGYTTTDFSQRDFWVVKLDDMGNRQWDRAFSGTSNKYDEVHSIIQTTDGSFVVAGYTKTDANKDDAWVIKFNTNGSASTPQPTYDDGLAAGRQFCIQNPDACGMVKSPLSVVYDGVTNTLSIPVIQVPYVTETAISYVFYEALLKVVSAEDNNFQLLVTDLAEIVQPQSSTTLTYDDGVEAGKQFCRDHPTSCGMNPSVPAIYDDYTNTVSIPEIHIPESNEIYEAKLKIISPPQEPVQLETTSIELKNQPPSQDSWRDYVGAGDAADFLKLYLTYRDQHDADAIIGVLENVNLAGEFINGITQYSGNSRHQVLFGLEFLLRNISKLPGMKVGILGAELISEGAFVRAAELVENDEGLNVAARFSGIIRDLEIYIKDGWLGLAQNVDVKIYRVIDYHDMKEISEYNPNSEINMRHPSEAPMYEGKFLSIGLGHSFGYEIPAGLYTVEISKNGEILKITNVLLEAKDKQSVTISL